MLILSISLRIYLESLNQFIEYLRNTCRLDLIRMALPYFYKIRALILIVFAPIYRLFQ